jgi:hypothetical protein
MPSPELPEPSLKKITVAEVAALFPHGKRIKNAINRRYARLLGFMIPGRDLYLVLVALGDTDPAAFVRMLDREPLSILGKGRYSYLPALARRCAIFEAAKRPRTQGAGA